MYVAAFLPKNDRWEKRSCKVFYRKNRLVILPLLYSVTRRNYFFRQNMRKTLIDIDSIFVGSKLK